MVNFNGDYAEFKIKVDLTKWISHLNKKKFKADNYKEDNDFQSSQ